MRKAFFVLTLFSATLFVYSAIRLTRSLERPLVPLIGDLKGFEDNSDSPYMQLAHRFNQKISSYSDQARKDETLYFWLSFLVTAFTAASTLFSSIQAASKELQKPERAQKFAIIIAFLTFFSTLANAAATHFNEQKTDETKKAADMATSRNQFFSDYTNAPADTKPAIIQSYAQRLD